MNRPNDFIFYDITILNSPVSSTVLTITSGLLVDTLYSTKLMIIIYLLTL